MRALFVISTVCTIPAWAAAQLATPAEEVGELERMIGHWEGAGRVWQEPGAEPRAWTASEAVEWTLDGFFVQSDLEVRSEAFPVPLSSRAIHGWDVHAGRYVACTASNLGDTTLDEAFWIDDTLLVTRAMIERGEPVLERVSTTYAGDTYRFVVERGIGLGEFHLHAEGEFRRVEQPSAPPTVATSTPIAPVATAMTKVLGLVGDWKMVGKIIPLTGMPQMPVEARESVRSLWGGRCLVNEVVGEPSPMGQYRGLGFLTWSARDEAYRHVWFDNMGSVQDSWGQFDGADLVYRFSGYEYGFPVVMRSRTTFDDAGRLAGFQVDRMAARGEPERSFDVVYEAVE